MAKLKVLPAQHIINGFKGTLDYYVHDGVNCVRSWPRSPGHHRAPAVEAQWSAFAWASKNWNSLSPYVQEAYKRSSAGTNLSARDLFTKSFIKDYFREGQWELYV